MAIEGGKLRPLEGVRVVDVTNILMGPAATQVLADYGADVIKVEGPGGDIMRHASQKKHEGMGPVYLHANRNKRSIVIDLKISDGRDALIELAASADMFVHNVRPAAMQRLRLDYDSLAAANPNIIYLALTGYDQRGPYAPMAAMDDIVQGLSGMASLLAQSTGGPPNYVPMAIVDRICAINAAQVALAALYMRERTGRGQSIEVPMFETIAQFVLGDHLGGETFDPPAGAMGYSRLFAEARRPYKTRDGYIAMLIYTDNHWSLFFEAIGQPGKYKSDPRFATPAMRAKHHEDARAMLSELLLERTTAEWLELLQGRDVPCMPLHDPRSLMNDPHLKAVDFFQMMDHPTEGRIRAMRVASRWSDADVSIRRHAPLAGEQSVEILREAGFADDRIERLVTAGAVVQHAGS